MRDFGCTETATKRIVMRQDAIDLGGKRLHVGEIHDADGAAANLVFIGRADTAAGGADLGAAVGGRVFAHAVQLAVQRKNEGGIVGDTQVFRGNLHALRFQTADFGDQRMRIDHDAIADDGELAGTHDAGRQKRKLVADAIDDKRMAGIMAALIPHDDICPLGQPVDNLAFAFVAPLRADHHNIRHFLLSCSWRLRAR